MSITSQIHGETRRTFAAAWFWLRNAVSSTGTEMQRPSASIADVPTEQGGSHDSGTVLRFPLRAEALLVRLAELLRRRVDELVPQSDRLSLTLSHQPMLRLAIDDNAHVEFNAQSAEFNLTIEALGGTRMIIQTTDFDAVVKFVLQYVLERLADDAVLEVAS